MRSEKHEITKTESDATVGFFGGFEISFFAFRGIPRGYRESSCLSLAAIAAIAIKGGDSGDSGDSDKRCQPLVMEEKKEERVGN